jgi:hypothetical protein
VDAWVDAYRERRLPEIHGRGWEMGRRWSGIVNTAGRLVAMGVIMKGVANIAGA